MQIVVDTDVATPCEWLFERIADFDRLERLATGYGATVNRRPAGDVTLGTAWDATMALRGQERRIETQLIALKPGASYQLSSQIGALKVQTSIECAAIGPSSRLCVKADMSAQSLKGRLLIQSMRLGQGRISEKMQSRLDAFARELEQEYRGSS